jgi:hypothetical protein
LCRPQTTTPARVVIRRSRLLVDGVLDCEAMITHASPLDGYDAGLKVQVTPGA